MNDTTLVIETGVMERLEGSFKVLIEQSEINPILSKTVEGFFTNFMKNTDEAALVELLMQLQEQLIPYILHGDE